MRVMLKVIEEYAREQWEHAIVLKADKSKCLIFNPRSAPVCDRPSFAGKLIDYTSSWPHLGNIISETEDDYQCIAAKRFLLIGQVNSVLPSENSTQQLKIACYKSYTIVYMVLLLGIYCILKFIVS